MVIYDTLDERLASIKALQEAVADNDLPSGSPEEGQAKILDNTVLIEILDKETGTRKKRGTGIRLTDDGFILTAMHVVQEELTTWSEVTSGLFKKDSPIEEMLDAMRGYAAMYRKGQRYPLDLNFFIGSPEPKVYSLGAQDMQDFVLLKAVIPGSHMPTGIRFARTHNLDEPVVAAGYKGLSMILHHGQIISRSFTGSLRDDKVMSVQLQDFQITAEAAPGMSGGPIITKHGELAGIILGAVRLQGESNLVTHGISSRAIVDMLQFAAYQLERGFYEWNPGFAPKL
ncbi:trypsin-like peptidase domain-containing protein [Candidatus Woesearchaeota archaeon]|nr:trypsin-like peptidase domain-containing protein [Candidatus Woesearchaeota archaeon]